MGNFKLGNKIWKVNWLLSLKFAILIHLSHTRHVIILLKITFCSVTLAVERFGGKKALGILLKSELCQKCSKFHMQFWLHVGVLNNVLYVFSQKFASFLKYYVCEKAHKFCRAHPLCCWTKNKTTFCFAKWWSHESMAFATSCSNPYKFNYSYNFYYVYLLLLLC